MTVQYRERTSVRVGLKTAEQGNPDQRIIIAPIKSRLRLVTRSRSVELLTATADSHDSSVSVLIRSTSLTMASTVLIGS